MPRGALSPAQCAAFAEADQNSRSLCHPGAGRREDRGRGAPLLPQDHLQHAGLRPALPAAGSSRRPCRRLCRLQLPGTESGQDADSSLPDDRLPAADGDSLPAKGHQHAHGQDIDPMGEGERVGGH